jgi:hypothetical protein
MNNLDRDRGLRRLNTEGLLADLARARSTDPDTSHEAADQVRRTGALRETQHAVLEAVRQWPGFTAVELAEKLAGHTVRDIERPAHWWRLEASRRLPELEPVYVRRGDARRCSVNGNPQTTWWPVER